MPAPRARGAAIASGLSVALVLAASAESIPARRLLLVTIDTLRADHVGAYGGSVPTPAIDGLAAAGVVLLGACTPMPTTGPAHASLLTGLHPWRHGVLDNAVPLPTGSPTLAEIAQRAGIPTAAFVSSYIVDARFGFARGFDGYRFEPGETYGWRGHESSAFWARGEATTDAALDWIEAHRQGSFFAWVHYFEPHHPYRPPAGFERPTSEPISLDGKSTPRGIPSAAHLRELIRGYRGEVAYVDGQVARLVEGLRAQGLLDSTAIVFTSDHGEGLGDHGLLEHGSNLFDELVRVPLVVRAPGVPAGRRLEGSAQLEDLMPTALALLGLDAPPGLDGLDLSPWLRGEAADSPRAAAIGRRKRSARVPDLFYERRWPDKWVGVPGVRGERFRLDADPRERVGARDPNAPPALAGALARAPAAPAPAPALDLEARRALEALGYLGEHGDAP